MLKTATPDLPATARPPALDLPDVSQVRWTSFSGRNYAIELSPTMANGSWTNIGQAFGSGLVTEYSFTMPAGVRRFVRVRELP